MGEDPDEAELILELTANGNKKKEIDNTGGGTTLRMNIWMT